MKQVTIGVLALQGCVSPHKQHLQASGAIYREVKNEKDFDDLDGLILPGGESTTMLNLLFLFKLEDHLRSALECLPCWGICAGAILMAKQITGRTQRSFHAVDISVQRNAYGRQIESFATQIHGYDVAFIRAPIITSVGNQVETLARVNQKPVWLRESKHMITTFHSEIGNRFPSPMHTLFVEMVSRASTQ